MDVEEVISLPLPHTRVAARRAQRRKEKSSDGIYASPRASISAPPGSSLVSTYRIGDPSLLSSPERQPSASKKLAFVPKDNAPPRIVLAVDYGTTFSGVAYAQSVGRAISLKDIQVVQKWPGELQVKVPSRISYSYSKKGLSQYGYEIDRGSTVLSNTKLELKDQDRSHELAIFDQVLHELTGVQLNEDNAIKGLIPDHLSMTAEEIVEDYLRRIADVTYADMIGHHQFGRAILEQIPIDVVITHPAVWTDGALNKTYRAVNDAFGSRFPTIRNISFVSEPEACAHYTLTVAQSLDHARFLKGDCFIVVDAGGGTVDLTSFQITDIDSTNTKFTMQRVGPIAGEACGSTYVDEGLIRILEKRLLPVDSAKIVGTSRFGYGGHFVWTPDGMDVLAYFLPMKHSFANESSTLENMVKLPEELNIKDDVARVFCQEDTGSDSWSDRGPEKFNPTIQGQEHLPFWWFCPKVSILPLLSPTETSPFCLPLIPRSFFCSSAIVLESPYLFSRVNEFAVGQHISIEKGTGCWCAVAMGAVMKGLGLVTEMPPVVTSSPCFYGIKTRQVYSSWRHYGDTRKADFQGIKWASGQINWLANKKDAILPGKDRVASCVLRFKRHSSDLAPPSTSLFSSKRNTASHALAPVHRDITFVMSSQDDAPTRWSDLDKSFAKSIDLRCDMKKVPSSYRYEYGTKTGRFVQCSVSVEVCVNAHEVTVTAKSGDEIIAATKTMPLSDTFAKSAGG